MTAAPRPLTLEPKAPPPHQDASGVIRVGRTRVTLEGVVSLFDSAVLARAADQDRVLVTHDVETVTRDAFGRVDAGLRMPGVIEVVAVTPIGRAVDDFAEGGAAVAGEFTRGCEGRRW